MDDWRNEIKKIYDDAGTGTFTEAQFKEIHRKIQIATIRGIYADAREHGPYKTADDAEYSMIQFGHEYRHIWLKANTEAGNLLVPYVRYYATVEVYSAAPYKSMTKRTLIDLMKIRPDDYLKDLAPDTSDLLTVYRGGGELTASAANCALSWTTDPNTAIFFFERRFDAAQLWKAQIYKKDVIAYYNGRSESEIIQYRKLKNIESLDLDDETIRAALDAREKQINKEYEMLMKGGAFCAGFRTKSRD